MGCTAFSSFSVLHCPPQELMEYFRERLGAVAREHGQRLLHTPDNPISMAITLDGIPSPSKHVGSALFLRGVSGTRCGNFPHFFPSVAACTLLGGRQ